MNLNFDITGTPSYTGAAVVDYTLQFAPALQTFSASCRGKIYPTGVDPFAPGATPYVEFDCAFLNGYLYKRVPLGQFCFVRFVPAFEASNLAAPPARA